MKVKHFDIIKRNYDYLVKALENRWSYQEGVNYGILCGHLSFATGNDFKLLKTLLDLYNNDIQSFLNFDFSNYR